MQYFTCCGPGSRGAICPNAMTRFKDEGALPIIPNRRNAIKQACCPKRFYRQRHKIENFFCRIKDWRRIATRYDKLARNFLAAAILTAALFGSSCESRP
jgi:transposase